MLVLIRILLINLSSRLCLYAGCTLVSKSAGFSIPSVAEQVKIWNLGGSLEF